jgi:predicted nucleotidyltransferase
MHPEKLLAEKRGEVLRIAALHGIREVRVFGSVARGEADEQSDIDFLVEVEPGRSLLDLGGMHADLERILERRVDLVTERSLKARVRDRVLAEARPL